MELEKLRNCLRRLHPRQAIYLNFATGSGSIKGVKALVESSTNQGVVLDGAVRMMLSAVALSNRWEDVSRSAAVWNLERATSNQQNDIAISLESVSAGDHLAKALFTGNKPKQEKATQEIISKVLDDSLVADMQEWDLRIAGEFVEIDGLPAVKFSIFNNALPVFRICLDGWSGRWKIGSEEWSDQRCTDATKIQSLIRYGMGKYLEKATAAAS